MTRVTLFCRTCGETARRSLRSEVGARGVQETAAEPAQCPKGHGPMERIDGGRVSPSCPECKLPRGHKMGCTVGGVLALGGDPARHFEELDGEAPKPQGWSEALKALRNAYYDATGVPLPAVVGCVEGKVIEDIVNPSLGFTIIRPSTGEYLEECGGWTKDVAGAVFLETMAKVSERWEGRNRAIAVVRRSYFLEFPSHQFGPYRTRTMAEAHAAKLHSPDIKIVAHITHP